MLQRKKNGQSSHDDCGSMGPNAFDRENRYSQTCIRSGQISHDQLSVPRQWKYDQSTCSPRPSSSWTMIVQLDGELSAVVGTGCARFMWQVVVSVGLKRCPSHTPRQAGRSDSCFQHQPGSAGRSAWCVLRVRQLCRSSQVRRRSARDARLVALAATHASPDLALTKPICMQRVGQTAVVVATYSTWKIGVKLFNPTQPPTA